jgi:hypothetical protein
MGRGGTGRQPTFTEYDDVLNLPLPLKTSVPAAPVSAPVKAESTSDQRE